MDDFSKAVWTWLIHSIQPETPQIYHLCWTSAVHQHHCRNDLSELEGKKKKRKICIPFLSIRLSPSPFWLLSTSYDIINHHLLGNRWRPATDPGQVEESKLQISSLGCFKRTLTFGNQIISSSTTAAPQPSRIWWAEVGSDKVQKLLYCIQVDFSCICTLLEYSFFWQFSIFAVQWRTQNDWGAGSFLKK